eukprot:3065506-Prymnesium_polylepis.1
MTPHHSDANDVGAVYVADGGSSAHRARPCARQWKASAYAPIAGPVPAGSSAKCACWARRLWLKSKRSKCAGEGDSSPASHATSEPSAC